MADHLRRRSQIRRACYLRLCPTLTVCLRRREVQIEGSTAVRNGLHGARRPLSRCVPIAAAQASTTQLLCAFLETNPFKKDAPQYHVSRAISFNDSTDDTLLIGRGAVAALRRAYRLGYAT